jgi:KDO2-lipid IV(A) lauroyltransferase
MAYYLVKAFSRLCCLLPSGVCELIGKALAAVLWPFVPQHRKRMAEDNARRCLGISKEEAARVVKASAVRFGPMLLEVMRFPVIKEHIADYVEIDGREYMKEGLALGRGGVIATAHSGNWELMGGALAASGFPIVGVAMKQKDAAMDRFINEYRRMMGMHITYKSDVREMFRMLQKGWVIGLLMDQDTDRRDGIMLDFFQQRTNCVTGPAAIARFRDVPIFPVYITRHEDGTHKLVIHRPVFVEHTEDKQHDIRQAMQKLNMILETHIRQYPEEWFWLHDRWKSMREE